MSRPGRMPACRARPIIFLDVDGVLNNTGCWGAGKPAGRDRLDVACVAQLARVIRVSGARVVFSSTWREMLGCREFETHLRGKGCEGLTIIGKTPVMRPGTRGDEIRAWLDAPEHDGGGGIGRIVALDDEDDGITAAGVPLARTNVRFGLSRRKADEAIRILLGKGSS
jgi:hypothetical protein